MGLHIFQTGNRYKIFYSTGHIFTYDYLDIKLDMQEIHCIFFKKFIVVNYT